MFDFDPNNFRLEDLDRIARESEEALRGLTDALHEIGQMEGQGEAIDGLIRVTVDSTGRATDVTIGPRAMRLGSAVLAEGVLKAFNAAQEDAQAKGRQLMMGALPEGVTQQDVTHDKIRTRFDETFESFNKAMGERQTALDELRREAEGL
jgi:DNA-binding protein YbaB